MAEPAGPRVLREPIACDLPAHRGAVLVEGDAHPFALAGAWAGGGALAGSEPIRVAAPDEDPFALLEDQPAVGADTEGALPGVVACGWVGYLGHRLGARLERLQPPPLRPNPLPDFALAFYDHLLHMDSRGRWFFEALWSPERATALEQRLAILRERAAALHPARTFSTGPWCASPGPGGHGRAVRACRERIHAGDLTQANVTMRLESRLDGDPADLFASGAAALAPDRAAFLAGPWGAVASLSPELFLERRGRTVRSAPIKGTAAATTGGDRLAASAKDQAENTMIVDLVRNDLGRVCQPGTIAVPALAEPREHTGVWHLVSEVTGRLPPGHGDADLLRASFPPGSVTGAPKIAALDAISELESTAREVYTGAIGFASPFAGLELSVAIRTFESDGDRLWLGVGGGVVADSDPATEAGECLVKALPLLDAIGGHMGDRSSYPDVAAPPTPGRHGPRPIPRPDPARGVFETLLVRDLTAQFAGEHLARLAASVEALYGTELPGDLPARIARAARRVGDTARMRVDVMPGDDGEMTTRVRTFPIRPRLRLELTTVTVPGGLGAHKWTDRTLIEALEAATEPALPLWCDIDGRVLEAARANVFVVTADGAVLTPPLDGRILPGTTRARVLARARAEGLETAEQVLGLDDLTDAAELFVTGAIGGVEGVTALDDEPAAGAGEIAHLLGGREERRRREGAGEDELRWPPARPSRAARGPRGPGLRGRR